MVGPPSRKEVLNHMGIAKAQYAKLLSEQRPVLAFVEEWRDQHPCDLIFFRPHQAETEATTVSDASLSEETWSRIKQLEKEGAVFLMNEENQVLAFGRKLPPEYILPCGGGGGREMPKFEVTEVMSQGTKVPAKDIVLKEGITTAWPGNLVLDVVVEALDEKVDDVGEDGDPRDSLKQPGDTLLFVYQSAPERSALIRHGNGVFFLDLLCRAKRSNLAVYAVKVLDSGKNKERYGAFIVTQNDRHEESGLREALVLLRSRSSKEASIIHSRDCLIGDIWPYFKKESFTIFHFFSSGIPLTASRPTPFMFRLRSKQLFRDAGPSSTASRESESGSGGSLNVLAAAEPGNLQDDTRVFWAVIFISFFPTITTIPNLTKMLS